MVEDGPTRTDDYEERGETRLRMMTRKMEANVIRNATKQTKKNYCTVFDYVQGAAGRDAARHRGSN